MKWQFEAEQAQELVPGLYPVQLDVQQQQEQTPVLNRQDLMERMGYDDQLLCEVVGLFQEDAPARLLDLENALARLDSMSFERAAHALKGMLLSLAAEPAAATAYSLENLGHSGRWWNANHIVSQLEEQIDELNLYLDRITKKVTS